jgi:hypothetical protein
MIVHHIQINKIGMSTTQLLAETDANMIQELNTLGYFKYIFLTVFGKGFGDRIIRENKNGTNQINPNSSKKNLIVLFRK